jgi:hypothetical protein
VRREGQAHREPHDEDPEVGRGHVGLNAPNGACIPLRDLRTRGVCQLAALGEVVSDVREDGGDLVPQEQHRDDHGNRDHGDDERVLDQALTFLLRPISEPLSPIPIGAWWGSGIKAS